MQNSVKESEVLAFLNSVESGAVRLTPLQEPQDVYAGTVDYTASNGWRVTIYNDANEWDYIEHVRTADGRECDYNFINEHMPQVDVYRPSDEVAWSRYRIPGYMKFRCVRCGQRCKGGLRPYVCRNCEAHDIA